MTFVAEQFPALGKIDAGATVQALEAAKPEAIFNVTFAGDLTNFVRQGNTRGLFEGRDVVSLLTGEPEYLDPLGARRRRAGSSPAIRWDQINTPGAQGLPATPTGPSCNDYPRLGSVVGYDTVNGDRRGARPRPAPTDTEKLVDAMRGLQVRQPVRGGGIPRHRPSIHHGRLCRPDRREGRQGRDGRLELCDGAKYLPPDEWCVETLRPQPVTGAGEFRRRPCVTGF